MCYFIWNKIDTNQMVNHHFRQVETSMYFNFSIILVNYVRSKKESLSRRHFHVQMAWSPFWPIHSFSSSWPTWRFWSFNTLKSETIFPIAQCSPLSRIVFYLSSTLSMSIDTWEQNTGKVSIFILHTASPRVTFVILVMTDRINWLYVCIPK